MKLISLSLSLFVCIAINAQDQKGLSLQESLNNALNKDAKTETKEALNSLEANADISQKAVQIKWESNTNNSAEKFIIEKSADKNTWLEVSTVFGASHKNEPFEYFHLDYMPLENLSYYRIVEVDKNGAESYSNVMPVNYILADFNTAGTNLFPALAISEEQTVITIAFEEVFEKEILLVMRDIKGKEFYSKVFINIENEHLVALPIENEIPKGDYLITASSENQIYSQNITIN